MKFLRLFFVFWIATAALLTPQPSSAAGDEKTYSPEEIMAAAESVFGEASKGLAEVIEKLFAEQGRPSAYIAGEEISGAFVVGLRYGKGDLNIKGQKSSPIYWQGPSIGFDFGGNASKAFVLIHSTRLNGINT
ncbi:MAG: EipA family protein [Proteobacteria bacterium]|nr:EipA family protein [Pseudomonadota bacterium]